MENTLETLMMQLESAKLQIKALTSALDKEKELHLQTQAKLPRIERGLNKANQFIYDMKAALINADSSFQASSDLFTSILAPTFSTRSVQSIAELYNAGKSLGDMAGILLGRKSKKTTMHRMLGKARKTHPELFITK